MEESVVGAEGLEFKWGKKKSVGGKKKDVTFYESFTYDGEEYCLYDCVLVGDSSDPDSDEPFVAMIIKMWEHSNKRAKSPRQVKLLWFFKPSEISLHLEGVPDVIPNELFLASGEGLGVANVNQLEAIGGKCSALCISKDERNPQPADEEIKSTDFVFWRAFDVGSCKVVDTIPDKIAGVDVKYIFNRAGCKKESTAVPKVEADVNGSLDNLQPNGVSVRKAEDKSIYSSDVRESDSGHDQLATNKSTLAEVRSNNDSGVQEDTAEDKDASSEASGSKGNHSISKKAQANDVIKQLTKQQSMPTEARFSEDSNGLDERPHKKQKLDGSVTVPDGRNTGDDVPSENPIFVKKKQDMEVSVSEGKYAKSATEKGTEEEKRVSSEASGSRGSSGDGKAQESETKNQFTKQKSLPTEERCRNSCEASSSGECHPVSKKAQVNDVKKQLTKQQSMPTEARYSKDSPGIDDRPHKKPKLDGSVLVPDRRNTNILQNVRPGGKKDRESLKSPRDKVAGDEAPLEKPNFVKKKQDMGVSVSEGRDAKTASEKGLSKKPSFDGKLLKRAGDKELADDYKRNYQVIEVSRKPDAGNSKWFRPLPWEESMREAEEQGRLVLLQNLDPTYTSDEVQDIVYSALNEQCTARMIERTLDTVSHIGQALVIFKSREAAERAVARLYKGFLLLSNGRPLVAAFAKINPPGKPSSFYGHIKLLKAQTRRETKDALATSHCSQPNNLEFDMAMEWLLLRARSELATETVSKRQLEQKKSLRINFKPKLT